MERLRNKFLNVPVDAVLHPASDSAQQAAKEQKDKATMALGDEHSRTEINVLNRVEIQKDDNSSAAVTISTFAIN